MRKQLSTSVLEIMDKDDRAVVLLGDIGVFAFRHVMQKYPDRAYNIGILEQSMISVAAGLSMSGMIPIVHTIAPFMIERAYEQLKVDFAYQNLGGNFISVGASYDYASLGATHHCPADVNILKNIPNMQIVLPGTALEFDLLLKESYDNSKPTYFRLSEQSNANSCNVRFGQAQVIKKGSLATVIAVGNMLDMVVSAVDDSDVTILYYTTVEPFDSITLNENCNSGKVLLCEPYYYGGLTDEIISAIYPHSVKLNFVGVPHEFISNYGTLQENNIACGITSEEIRRKLRELIYE